MSNRKILITTALPYANADLHLGHMLEHIQADIWSRFQKMRGHDCIHICGDDAHGTAITLSADKQKITPEKLIESIHVKRLEEFKAFNIFFDQYHSTHSAENKTLVSDIYCQLKKTGYILSRTITQAYDPVKKMFLADRYIKGVCPKCSAKDQYGDNCEVCGATYDAFELKQAYSTLSGEKPIAKKSKHLFFKLSAFQAFLNQWTQLDEIIPSAIQNKLKELLEKGLKDWDISRDAPYFGFEIPEEIQKYFYVWLDAPVGYMAAFKAFCHKNNRPDFDDYWQANSAYELHHFIGKDIVNFHCLFWPAILHALNYRKPSRIHVHGYLTFNAEKMSKSRGTLISVQTYIKYLKPEYLRYYIATKLAPGIQDYDLNTQDFMQRINSDLVGKLVNIASRCAKFMSTHLNHHLKNQIEPIDFLSTIQAGEATIAAYYEQGHYSKAMRLIMTWADQVNEWIDHKKPWVIAKQTADSTNNQLHHICFIGLNAFRLLVLYMKPTLPELALRVEDFLCIPPLQWQDAQQLLLNHDIKPFEPLMQRITTDQIENLLLESTLNTTQQETIDVTITENTETIVNEIDFSYFSKMDLRVGQVIQCEVVPDSDKLLRFEIDLGESKSRIIFSGLKQYYHPADLINTWVIVVANLKPRKMRFGTSEGMILSAGEDQPTLLSLPDGLKPGMRIE
ncbi:MAG: methionine--tRNA ligase [Endozoicomonadaceae bacterium]|nr:methionine--tRNA ligase [Endozoicomonadaceae bacterium]